MEGLIHISELDWQLIDNPQDIIKRGEKVKAKVIANQGGRVSLSLKALKKDPWQGLEKKFKVNDKVKGQIIKINNYGAFVQINKNIHALLHISEFADHQPALAIGQKAEFKITALNPQEHKMALALA